jgi:hypothetical protein
LMPCYCSLRHEAGRCPLHTAHQTSTTLSLLIESLPLRPSAYTSPFVLSHCGYRIAEVAVALLRLGLCRKDQLSSRRLVSLASDLGSPPPTTGGLLSDRVSPASLPTRALCHTQPSCKCYLMITSTWPHCRLDIERHVARLRSPDRLSTTPIYVGALPPLCLQKLRTQRRDI